MLFVGVRWLILCDCGAGSLIKPSFAQPGLKHPSRKTTSANDIALATATALVRSVPIGVAGVVFLSGRYPVPFIVVIELQSTVNFHPAVFLPGGLSDSDAALYLHKINHIVNTSQAPSPLARLPPLYVPSLHVLICDADTLDELSQYVLVRPRTTG